MSVPKKRNHGKLPPSTKGVDDPSLKYTKAAPKCEQVAEHWPCSPLPEPESIIALGNNCYPY
ncbi:ANM_collapsed_G0031260.mRNA.1.CDS.1 [Saccharomyces cerevisiae]|nr:ANM_collapsed_G0031260.mRNA.1.CDS.1 [Saccharomyces cerevisiae]